jgi:hypothetical protein
MSTRTMKKNRKPPSFLFQTVPAFASVYCAAIVRPYGKGSAAAILPVRYSGDR